MAKRSAEPQSEFSLGDTRSSLRAPAKRPRRRMERVWRLRRFSWLGLSTVAATLAVLATVLFAWLPPRLSMPEAAPLDRSAVDALLQGEPARAYPWLRAMMGRPLDPEAGEQAALHNPHHRVSVGELVSGYEGLAARDLLLGAPWSLDFRNLVMRALVEAHGAQFIDVLRDPHVEPALTRAISHQLMHPSLRAIGRTAAGLPPTDRLQLASDVNAHRNDEPAPARGLLAEREVEWRLRAAFAFLRDSVAVLPDRPLAERGMRFPLDTLYQGNGRLAEVNWLALELMQAVMERDHAWGVELLLAPPPMVVYPPTLSAELPPALPDSPLVDIGMPERVGGDALVVVLVRTDAGLRLYAFDGYAGVPLLNEEGRLLDLFAWFAGEQSLHQRLAELLPYGRHRARLAAGRVRLTANPVRAGAIGHWLSLQGLDVAPFDGPSPFTVALADALRDEDGRWHASAVELLGPPEHENDVRARLRGVLAEARRAGEMAVPAEPFRVGTFPYTWRWQPAASWWIVEALQAEMHGPAVPNDAIPDPIQRTAHDDNRMHRQQALDYRRPSDATSLLETAVYTYYDPRRLGEAFVFPPAPDPDRPGAARPPIWHSGPLLGGSIVGPPLLGVPDALRRLAPPVVDWSRLAVRRTQGRVTVGLCHYWAGDWELAAMTLADYQTALGWRETTDLPDRYPGAWRYLAAFVHGRALQRLDRPEMAAVQWASIPSNAPLGVAARIPDLLVEPRPYVDLYDDIARW